MKIKVDQLYWQAVMPAGPDHLSGEADSFHIEESILRHHGKQALTHNK